MCLNRIFKEEQIAPMRYSAQVARLGATPPNRRLGEIARELEPYPYNHRPHLPRGLNQVRSSPSPNPSSPAALAWENEGGAL